MPFPNNMLIFRRRACLTQDQLALKVNITQARISDIENEKQGRVFPRHIAVKIKDVLNFPGPIDELFDIYDPDKYGPLGKWNDETMKPIKPFSKKLRNAS